MQSSASLQLNKQPLGLCVLLKWSTDQDKEHNDSDFHLIEVAKQKCSLDYRRKPRVTCKFDISLHYSKV